MNLQDSDPDGQKQVPGAADAARVDAPHRAPSPDPLPETGQAALAPQAAAGAHIARAEAADLDAAEQASSAFVQANLRRNYIANFLHGVLGLTGFRLVNAPTFVPAYLKELATPLVGAAAAPGIVGLAIALQNLGGVLSSIHGATLIEHRRRVLPVAIWVGMGIRVPIGLLALSGWLVDPGWGLLTIVIASLFLFGLTNGPQRVIFQFLLAKVIPINRRGHLLSWRNLIGGFVAAALAYLASEYLIGGNVFGNGFATTFALAFMLTTVGLTCLALLIREPEATSVRPRSRAIDRLREIPALLRNEPAFAWFVVAMVLATGGAMAWPFYVNSVTSVLLPTEVRAGLSDVEVAARLGGILATMSLSAIVFGTLANLPWGWLADRVGFHLGFMLSLCLWLLGTFLIVTSGTLVQAAVAFAVLGASQSGFFMAAMSMPLEFGDRRDMALRLAACGMADGAMATVGPLLGGAIAAAFGYTALFATSAGFLAAALMVLLLKVPEPRRVAPQVRAV